ncbi:MAG: cbb3-type cytochrome c oxidase subunit I [Verrucomicrobiae bacterium]|nr:cbb3-type cytochrome c oxidase subunit I [Verrucomicrobiae bacterium]
MSPSTYSPTGREGVPTLAEVDASCRWLACLLVPKAAAWGVIGTLLLLVASIKLHAPGLGADHAWLGYGRLAPAGWSALVYGFVGQAAMAVGLWVVARASRQRLQAPFLIGLGGACWNLGILGGVVGVLAGYSTGREWLEMPVWAMTFAVIGAAFVGVAGWMTFATRTEEQTYPSAWFVLLGLLAFVWVGTVALLMLGGEGVRGVTQVLVQRWFAGGVSKLWLGGIAAGIVFHFLPLLANRPLASRPLALIGFWSLAVFTPWAITMHGDPFPRWVVSLGMAGQALGMIGLVSIALNWWKTAEGALGAVFSGGPGRLLGAAAMAYVAGWGIQYLAGLPQAAAVLRLTWIHQGQDWLWVGGAVGLAVMAVVPEMVERATGRPLNSGLMNWNGRLMLIGVGLIAIPLLLAGVVQGLGLNSGTRPFLEVLRGSMHWVRLSTLGYMVLLAGQLVFLLAVMGWWRTAVREWMAGVVAYWSAPVSDDRMEVRS